MARRKHLDRYAEISPDDLYLDRYAEISADDLPPQNSSPSNRGQVTYSSWMPPGPEAGTGAGEQAGPRNAGNLEDLYSVPKKPAKKPVGGASAAGTQPEHVKFGFNL